jgi:hypothetical protein
VTQGNRPEDELEALALDEAFVTAEQPDRETNMQ